MIDLISVRIKRILLLMPFNLMRTLKAVIKETLRTLLILRIKLVRIKKCLKRLKEKMKSYNLR
jgi:hypothetical protein